MRYLPPHKKKSEITMKYHVRYIKAPINILRRKIFIGIKIEDPVHICVCVHECEVCMCVYVVYVCESVCT